jgi:CheY-like chemotaxis protein
MALVLIVEDESVLAEMIADLVDDMGHEALIAANGDDALRALARRNDIPALVLSDIMMPKMNGLALTHALRHTSRFMAIPVVLMSAAGKPKDLQGANTFIAKPFDLEQFSDIITGYINPNN